MSEPPPSIPAGDLSALRLPAAALALRRRIFEALAETGQPPAVPAGPGLDALIAHRVVVVGPDLSVRMAHPFAAAPGGALVQSQGRRWWGNCAWDGLGIVAALALREATVIANGITLSVRAGELSGEAVFHVAVPARRWWADIGFT